MSKITSTFGGLTVTLRLCNQGVDVQLLKIAEHYYCSPSHFPSEEIDSNKKLVEHADGEEELGACLDPPFLGSELREILIIFVCSCLLELPVAPSQSGPILC